MGAAPDNITEFGEWVESVMRHFVDKYGAAEIARWRFRLGTEAQGNRMGPTWTGPTGNDPAPMNMADGTVKNFSNGLQ